MQSAAWRAFDWQHRELTAGRAEVGKKVGAVFNGMRLAPDQAHRTTAKLTTNWGRRRLLFELDDLVHDATLRQASRPSILFLCNQCLRRCSRLHWPILLLGLGLNSFRNRFSLLQRICHLHWFGQMSKLLI